MTSQEADREIITPHAGLARRAEHAGSQVASGDADERVLLLWARSLAAKAALFADAKPTGKLAGEAEVWRGKWGGVPVTLVAPGIGAPATAIVVEKLAACGARAFAGVGFGGVLNPLHASGMVLTIDRAETDSGIGPAYLAPGESLEATPSLKESLETGLSYEVVKHQCATAWTTDAVYRETVGKAREFRKRGASVVDMETAALYAVAKRRSLVAGALLVAADELCRFAPLDVTTPDNLVWEWKPAPPGSLDAPAAGALRAALGAVTGVALSP